MAYLIVYARVTDPPRIAAYAAQAQALFAAHGGVMTARGAPVVLEGEFPWQGVVVFRFASVAAAQTVWRSAEYAALHQAREGAADFQVIVIDELDAVAGGAA
jgi:uncharacterized protein (DUF1330 family)